MGLQAVADQRVKALYDLGGPINTKAVPHLPFILKTKMCQVIGARDTHAIAEVLGKNSTESDDILSKVTCPVRMAHGARDRVVSIADKEWLRDQLVHLGNVPHVSLAIYADGDHCCTGHADKIRANLVAFFREHLQGREH